MLILTDLFKKFDLSITPFPLKKIVNFFNAFCILRHKTKEVREFIPVYSGFVQFLCPLNTWIENRKIKVSGSSFAILDSGPPWLPGASHVRCLTCVSPGTLINQRCVSTKTTLTSDTIGERLSAINKDHTYFQVKMMRFFSFSLYFITFFSALNFNITENWEYSFTLLTCVGTQAMNSVRKRLWCKVSQSNSANFWYVCMCFNFTIYFQTEIIKVFFD